MHLYGTATSKPANSYDLELVAAAPGDSVDNYCKRHGGGGMTPNSEYTYTHVWQRQPASLPAVDLVQYQHAIDLAPSSSSSAVAMGGGAMRHCCRDHAYESPTFDVNGLERSAPSVFPPYYYHAAVARPSESQRVARQPQPQLQLGDMTAADEHRHHSHQQQHQQPGGQVSDEISCCVSVAADQTATTTTTTTTALGAGEWYQPCHTLTRYQPVICRSSSSDPDVTHRACTENHYT